MDLLVIGYGLAVAGAVLGMVAVLAGSFSLLLLGMALFGTGPLLIAGETLVILPESEVGWRLLVAFGLALWAMWTVASLAFLFSSLVENAVGPIIGTMAVLIVFYAVSNIPLDLFAEIRPYLFTSHLNLWQTVMEQPMAWLELASSAGALGLTTLSFVLGAWYIFATKDILS